MSYQNIKKQTKQNKKQNKKTLNIFKGKIRDALSVSHKMKRLILPVLAYATCPPPCLLRDSFSLLISEEKEHPESVYKSS